MANEQGGHRLHKPFPVVGVWHEEANPVPPEMQEQLDDPKILVFLFGDHPVDEWEMGFIVKKVGPKAVTDLKEAKGERSPAAGVKSPWMGSDDPGM